MKTRRRRLIFLILGFFFLIMILFIAFPLIHRTYARNTLERYGKLHIGMGQNEVIQLLGQPLNVKIVRSGEQGFEGASWDFTKETIDKLRSRDIPLERYLYLIKLLPSLSRHMKPRVGVEIYINQENGRVMLIHRLH